MLSYFEEILAEQAELWAGEEEIFSLGGSGVLSSFSGDVLSSGEDLFPSLDVAVMEDMERAEKDSFGHVGLGEDGPLLSGMMTQEVARWAQEEKSPGGKSQEKKSPGGKSLEEKSPGGKSQEEKSPGEKSQKEKMQLSKKRTEDYSLRGGLEGLGAVEHAGSGKYQNGLGYLSEGSGLRYLGEELGLGSGIGLGLGSGQDFGNDFGTALGGGIGELGGVGELGDVGMLGVQKYQNGLGYLSEGSGLRYLGEELGLGSGIAWGGVLGHGLGGGSGIGLGKLSGERAYGMDLAVLGAGQGTADVLGASASVLEKQIVSMKSPLVPQVHGAEVTAESGDLARALVYQEKGSLSGADFGENHSGDVLALGEVSRSLLGKMVSGERAVAQTETVAQQWQSGGTGVSLEKKLGHDFVAETVKDFDRAVARDARRYDGISG